MEIRGLYENDSRFVRLIGFVGDADMLKLDIVT